MTPYGAFDIRKESAIVPYTCECPYCTADWETVRKNEKMLALHNLWTIQKVIRDVAIRIREDTLPDYLAHVAHLHQKWFPDSRLMASWDMLSKEHTW